MTSGYLGNFWTYDAQPVGEEQTHAADQLPPSTTVEEVGRCSDCAQKEVQYTVLDSGTVAMTHPHLHAVYLAIDALDCSDIYRLSHRLKCHPYQR